MVLESILKDHVIIEGKGRQQWPNKLQFLCANISYAVGLGNIWRFPYLAAKNGGGTFLIPYAIALFFIGIPLLMTEMALGQRLRFGPIEAYNMFHPGFGGIGVAMAMISFFVGIYYTMISGWSLYYLFNSFQDPLPWASCPNSIQEVSIGLSNLSIPYPVTECQLANPSNYFWYRTTLNISDGLSELGGIQPDMLLCLFFAWVVIFYTMMNGSESAGAKLYFIAFFPYVVLFIFLVVGLVQKGGPEGLNILMTPDWNLLASPGIWIDASSQIFYSFGVCFGGIIAFSSYNPLEQNLVRDGLIVASFNCGTSIFAACVIFALLGGSAQITYDDCLAGQADFLLDALNEPQNFFEGQELSDIYAQYGAQFNLTKCDFETILINDIPQGTGLTFIAIARAVVSLPASYMFALLFYALITMLGIGSMIGTLEGVLTPIADAMQGYKSLKSFPKSFIMAILCVIHFSIGVIFTTGAGSYWLDIFNDYSANINLLAVGLGQYVFIHWFFGSKYWLNETKWMIGEDGALMNIFCWYLRICATFISPVLIFAIILFFVYDMIVNEPGYKIWDESMGSWQKDSNGTEIKFPYDAAGTTTIILLHIFALIWIPVYLIKAFFKNRRFSFSNWRAHDKALIYIKKDI